MQNTPATYSIYWARLPSHLDVSTEGYIGITKRDPEIRFREHRLSERFPPETIFSVIGSGMTENEAKTIEFGLRPTWWIGWNIALGGQSGNRPVGIHTSGWKMNLTDEQKKKRSERVSRGNNPMAGAVGRLHPRWKPFVVDGRIYHCIREASEITGEDGNELYTKLHSSEWPTVYYVEKSSVPDGVKSGDQVGDLPCISGFVKKTPQRNHVWSKKKRKPIVVEGRYYPGRNDAAGALDVSLMPIKDRLKDGRAYYIKKDLVPEGTRSGDLAGDWAIPI